MVWQEEMKKIHSLLSLLFVPCIYKAHRCTYLPGCPRGLQFFFLRSGRRNSSSARVRLMSKAKRKAVEAEEIIVEKSDDKKKRKDKAEEKVVEKEEKKNNDEAAVKEEDGDGEDDVGEKERLKLIKARRKQMLDDIRDEQNKAVAAAQVRLSPTVFAAFS